MKCINKFLKYTVCFIFIVILVTGCSRQKNYVTEYEAKNYDKSVFTGNLFATSLCVATNNKELANYTTDAAVHAVGLFNVNNSQVLYAQNIHEQLYPASTTKLLTAYVALKYGKLSDIVTVSENATQFESSAQVCGLQAGDQLTLEALLNGLLLYSGNDNAVAIAEHISGSVAEFATLMNKEASKIGATNTHFMNPHGLHEDDHYTTAYDLYLIFNECIKDERFVNIIGQKSYTATITNPASGIRTANWLPTNYYSLGKIAQPDNVTVVGGKTGTTDQAGSCVILLLRDSNNNPYISIAMGAPNKDTLYKDMAALISALPQN